MIARVLNFFFVGLAALSCLALYRVSENTRVANMELSSINRQIAQEKSTMNVLQAEWQRVANPGRIQKLAQSYLGMNDAPVMELSSFDTLPRRGENPLDANPVQNASVTMPAAGNANLHLVVARN
ncbi:MAG TPA: cell division protein FtsL [Rhizomicrobium sp.]|nr:cell division protein FtsL [Rhizomicrobium sp.]